MANNNQNSPVGYVSLVEGPAATEKGKPLKEGQSVFMDTQVETGKGGSLQIQFINGSQMALGAGKVAKVCDYFQPDSIQPELEPATKVALAGDPSLNLPPPTAGLPESDVTKLPNDPTIDLPPPAAGNPGGGNGSSSVQGGVRIERLGRRGNIGAGFETEDVTPAIVELRFDTGGLIPRSAAAGSPLPTIVPTDHNGGNPLVANGHNTVWEAGLLTAATTETATGTIIITASDGLASISIGGTTLRAAELAALNGAPRTINTGEGNLILTGYNIGTGVLDYSYTLLAAQNQPGADDSLDSIALMATDLNGDTGSGTLLIQIIDDAPTAAADSNSITEDAVPNRVSGSVLPNDTVGADANANPVTPATVTLTYGSLVLNSDGSYTYTLDNANPTVNALKDGRSLTETYTYTLTDGDGDSSTALLSLTINGHTDGDPTILPTDHNGGIPAGANGQNTVWEEGLVIAANTETTTGTIVISAPDGLASVNIGGTTLTAAQLATLAGSPVTINTGEGNLTLTNFNAGTGVLDYSYTLLAAQNQPGASDSFDSIALSVTDMGGSTGSGILSVQIIDDTPTAQNDTATAVEAGGIANGTPGTNPVGNVLTNDDVGADANVTPVTPATVALTYGSLVLNSNGGYTYTLDNNNAAVQSLRTSTATLTDSYSYTLTDGDGDTTTAILTVTIQGANDAPVAVADTATAVEAGTSAGTNPTGNVLDNDTDVDSGDTKTLTAISGSGGTGILGGATTGTYGNLVLNADGSYSYTVDNADARVQALRTSANTLTDTFTYSMQDTAGATSTTTLTLTIQGANDAPVAVADTATAVETGGVANGTPGTDPVGNVLTNDIDVDSGDTKTVTAIAGGTVGAAKAGNYGSIVLNADGSYTYTLDNANATVQALRTSANTLNDTFTYSMQDTAGATSTTTLTLTIQGANDAPVAVADTATAVEAGAAAGTNPTGNVLANDTDVDSGDTKTLTAISGSGGTGILGGATTGAYGSLTVNADGSYTYTVDNANATVQALRTSANTLTDTFTYSMQDTAGTTSTTTLTLTIQGANDAPTAANDTATAVEAGGINNGTPGTNPTGNVLTNDSDPDSGDTITLAGITGGTLGGATAGNYGSIVLNTNGSYTYTLNNNHADVQGLRTSADTLIDSFTYSIQDTAGATSTANLRVTVQGANDAPVAVADTAAAVSGAIMNGTNPTGNLLTNDTDADGSSDTKTVTAISGSGGAGTVGGNTTGSYGTLALDAAGNYSYTVDNSNAAVQTLTSSAQSITDTFTYSMRDTDGATSTTTLTVTILGADTPLVLDLNADGVHSVGLNAGVVFDVNADGIARETGWISPEDGLLVRDLNGDGQINDGSELFGNGAADGQGGKTGDGFEALSLLDDNQDGVIDSLDGAFNELRVWQDRDTDGTTDGGELVSLESLGIQSLNLTYSTSNATESGNLHGLVGSYTSTDGQSHEMTDVFFATGAPVPSAAIPTLIEVVGFAAEDSTEYPIPLLTDEAVPILEIALPAINLLLVMDTSASMGQIINNSLETRLNQAVEAAQGLIEELSPGSDLNVHILGFDASAQILTRTDWVDGATALELLGGLQASAEETRDFEIALEQVMNVGSFPTVSSGSESRVYFFSDGAPAAGDLDGIAADWRAFASAHFDQVQAFGQNGDFSAPSEWRQITADPSVHEPPGTFAWDRSGIVALDESGAATWLNVNWAVSPETETLTATRNGVDLLSIEMTDPNHGGAFVVSQYVPLTDLESIRVPYSLSGQANGNITLEIEDAKIAETPAAGPAEGMTTDILVFDGTDDAGYGDAVTDTPFFESTLDLSSLVIPTLDDGEALRLDQGTDIGQITLFDLIDIADDGADTLFVEADQDNGIWVDLNGHSEPLTQQSPSGQEGYLHFTDIDRLSGLGYSLHVDQDINLHTVAMP